MKADKYVPVLSVYETQEAIEYLKRTFEERLRKALNLTRVSAPLFVDPTRGLNDNLNGVERPVQFDIPYAKRNAEVVHSLAKWKRLALKRYGFSAGEGIYTDMNAIRRDEELDCLHSIYVDQWDWERILTEDDRNIAFLKDIVHRIVGAICDTNRMLCLRYPALTNKISREISFVTSQELLDAYPNATSKERENLWVREHGTTFLMQIGGVLSNGERHDGRAPDYDDWSLNGDLLFWDDCLGCAMEISSMGIRVNSEVLDKQLHISGCDDRRELEFHRMVLNSELPLTIGGGIGQSRLSMLLLEKVHICEVQASVWDAATEKYCAEAGIPIL